jgi:hypothetical protein
MKALPLGLALVLLAGAVAVGCEDDRGAADLGAGGDGGAQGGAGGAQGGAGGAQGGAAGGEGGAPQCPSDLFAADGEECAAFGEGFICSDGTTDPCQFGQAIVCQGGKWERREAFPAPCGGAGGAAGAGGAG